MGEVKIAKLGRGGKESKHHSLEENRGQCSCSAGDDDRIFYLSKDHGSRWKYKTEALTNGWTRELHLNIINVRHLSEWVIFSRKT